MIYDLPFEEKKIVMHRGSVQIEADSKVEAYSKLKEIVKNDDFESYFPDYKHSGIAAEVDDCFSGEDHYILDNTLEEMKVIELPTISVSFDIFKIARFCKGGIYATVEQTYLIEHGIEIDIEDMDLNPIRIEEDEVMYEVVLKEYSAS